MRLLLDKGRNILARLTSLIKGLYWVDMSAGELSENDKNWIALYICRYNSIMYFFMAGVAI